MSDIDKDIALLESDNAWPDYEPPGLNVRSAVDAVIAEVRRLRTAEQWVGAAENSVVTQLQADLVLMCEAWRAAWGRGRLSTGLTNAQVIAAKDIADRVLGKAGEP
jgi:predicted metalloprotease